MLYVYILISLLLPLSVWAEKNKFHSHPKDGIANEYIVILKSDFDFKGDEQKINEKADKILKSHKGKKIKDLVKHAFPGFLAIMSEADALKLSEDSNVELVEQNAKFKLNSFTETSVSWGQDRVDQKLLPLNSIYMANRTGAGVHAYVIDSGIRYTHEEVAGRAFPGIDTVGDGQNGNDCHGHGSHVAGTIGGKTVGIAKDVTLHSARVVDCAGGIQLYNIILAMDWIIANHISPAVANMSIGAGGTVPSMLLAIEKLVDSGVTIAVAAGNSAYDGCFMSPSNSRKAIVVGASYVDDYTDPSVVVDARAPYSNYGKCVDIFAPGWDITSLSIGSDTALRSMSGTSMASPHVAGAAALYLEGNPDATPYLVESALVGKGAHGIMTKVGEGSPNVLLQTMSDQYTCLKKDPIISFSLNTTNLLIRNLTDYKVQIINTNSLSCPDETIKVSSPDMPAGSVSFDRTEVTLSSGASTTVNMRVLSGSLGNIILSAKAESTQDASRFYTTTSSVEIVPFTYISSVASQSTNYSPGATVSITAQIKAGLAAGAGVKVSFVVSKPSGGTVSKTVTSATNGNAVMNYRHNKSKDGLGFFVVTAKITVNGVSHSKFYYFYIN